MPPSPVAHAFESLFHASSVDLVVPESGSFGHDGNASTWWNAIRSLPTRHVAFLDEKLFYLVVLSIPIENVGPSSSSSNDDEPPPDLLRYLSRLQLTMTASFVPPLAPQPPPSNTTPNPNLLPPKTPNIPTTPDFGSGLPPVTPNPFPMMDEGEERYAHIDGVTVWEGTVEEQYGGVGTGADKRNGGDAAGGGETDRGLKALEKDGRVIVKREGRWEVVWKGHVPVAYVRTNIQHPLLSLTASITLRDTPQRKRGNAETGSILSATETVRTDGDVEHLDDREERGLAGMEEIDILGGLAGGSDTMPTSRLAPSIRQDLSLPPKIALHTPMTAITPPSAADTASSTASLSTAGPSRERAHLPPPMTSASEGNTTLRKSYRRVLSLSSGLRVRMRTLFLPQLLPPRVEGEEGEEDNENDHEGEKRIVLSVEVENPVESAETHPFEVSSISVHVGGKGGKATTRLMCDPSASDSSTFPLRLQPVEQYNLLYTVEIASAPEDRNGQGIEEILARSLGRGDEQRPVAITVIGRPYAENPGGGTKRFPTREFSSRWNCNLDLTPFYNSLSSTIPPLPVLPPQQQQQSQNRYSKPVVPLSSNAITGDKRYSLASLISQPPDVPRPVQQRLVSGTTQRPINLPSNILQHSNSAAHANSTGLGRATSSRHSSIREGGLLVSVKVLPTDSSRIEPLEPFSLEVFVHNRTEEVRRFRLSVPGREEVGRVRDIWQKRRRRRADEPDWGVDDPVLRQMLLSHLTSAPPLIPLEDDLRCGPLLPGASTAARLRFMALREGVHTLEKLRVTGVNDEFDFVMSPVLDIVVGSGVDSQ